MATDLSEDGGHKARSRLQAWLKPWIAKVKILRQALYKHLWKNRIHFFDIFTEFLADAFEDALYVSTYTVTPYTQPD